MNAREAILSKSMVALRAMMDTHTEIRVALLSDENMNDNILELADDLCEEISSFITFVQNNVR